MKILNSNTSGKLASNALANLSKATCLFTHEKNIDPNGRCSASWEVCIRNFVYMS